MTFRPQRWIADEVWAHAGPRKPQMDGETPGIGPSGAVLRLRRCLPRGEKNRRLIAEKTIDGVEYSYHATKGWRRRPA